MESKEMLKDLEYIEKDLEYIEKDLEYIDGFTASLKDLEYIEKVSEPVKKVFVNEATRASRENRPFVWVWHREHRVCKGASQIANIFVWNPSDAPWFSGWVKYFIGNGSVIDPDIMKKPAIPGAFQCMDKRFPELVRRVQIRPGMYQHIQLPYRVPNNIESGTYFGNAFLLRRKYPFPEFVTGSYGDFEASTCGPYPPAPTTDEALTEDD